MMMIQAVTILPGSPRRVMAEVLFKAPPGTGREDFQATIPVMADGVLGEAVLTLLGRVEGELRSLLRTEAEERQ